MQSNSKYKLFRCCSCGSCRRGRHATKLDRKYNNRKIRRIKPSEDGAVPLVGLGYSD